jgi:hypothetical protein
MGFNGQFQNPPLYLKADYAFMRLDISGKLQSGIGSPIWGYSEVDIHNGE